MDDGQGGLSKGVDWQGGGGFRFGTLGATVFDEYGCLNPETKFPSLSAPIWYLETRAPIGNKKCSALLGVHNDTGYYLLYNGIVDHRRVNGGTVHVGNVLTGPLMCRRTRL